MNAWFKISLWLLLLLPVGALAQATSQSFTVDQWFGEPPTEPPSIPANVMATPVASSQIDISWDASTHTAPVVGYQVFRDLVQVATTAGTFFADTGLTASTTYSYTVRSFDGFGNISSSSLPVATTTFALSPPAPDPEDPTGPSRQASQVPLPTLVEFSLEPGSHNARLAFTTSVPVWYSISYGQGETLTEGQIQTDRFASDHVTVLTDLEPGTTYTFELYVTDRFNREVLLRQGMFTTSERFAVESPENVLGLQANAVDSDVSLRWQNPSFTGFAYVRVVRNHRFYPLDPWDGFVVYEGVGNDFFDTRALLEFDRQYYTVFVYNLNGDHSSGAIASAVRGVRIPPLTPPPVVPEPTPTATSTPDELVLSTVRVSDIEFIQQDELIVPPVDTVSLLRGVPFIVRLPYETVLPHLKVIIFTLYVPEGQPATVSYLLRSNPEQTHYQATIPALTTQGEHPFTVTVYDVQTERQHTVVGTITLTAPDEPLPAGDPTLLLLLYLFLLSVAGLFATMLARWLWFLLYRRRREAAEDKPALS